MIFIFFLGYNSYQNNTVAFSSVYLTINPEVRMELNKNGRVLDLIGENSDGRDLIAGYSIKNNEKTEVANDLIDRAIDMGFLKEGDFVNISIDVDDPVIYERYGLEFKRSIKEHLDGDLSVHIEVMTQEEKEEKEKTKKQEEKNKKEKQNQKKSSTSKPKKQGKDQKQPSQNPSQNKTSQPNSPSYPPTPPSQPTRPAPAPRSSSPTYTPPAQPPPADDDDWDDDWDEYDDDWDDWDEYDDDDDDDDDEYGDDD